MLSSSQLSILRYHAEAGDRIAYYTALADFGDEYGRLALDVVLNNYLAGAAANSFFLDQSGGVSNSTLATISLKLMQADFARRDDLNGADLTVDDIQPAVGSVISRTTFIRDTLQSADCSRSGGM